MKDGYYFYLINTVSLPYGSMSRKYYFLLFCPGNEAWDCKMACKFFADRYGFILSGGCTYSLNDPQSFFVNILDGKNAAIAMKEKIEYLNNKKIAMVI